MLQFSDIASLAFSSQDHAYGSILHTLGGFIMVVAFAATVMAVAFGGCKGLGSWRSQRRRPPCTMN